MLSPTLTFFSFTLSLFPPSHFHFFASHSHFPFCCSVGFFYLFLSLFAWCNEGVFFLVLVGNAVTPLSLFSLSHSHFFPPLHSHFFASHSHFTLSCSDGFSLRFSLFLQWWSPLLGPLGECCHPTLTFLPHTFTFHYLVLFAFFARNIFSLSFSFTVAQIYTLSLNWFPLKLEPLRFKHKSYFNTFLWSCII